MLFRIFFVILCAVLVHFDSYGFDSSSFESFNDSSHLKLTHNNTDTSSATLPEFEFVNLVNNGEDVRVTFLIRNSASQTLTFAARTLRGIGPARPDFQLIGDGGWSCQAADSPLPVWTRDRRFLPAGQQTLVQLTFGCSGFEPNQRYSVSGAMIVVVGSGEETIVPVALWNSPE